MKNFAFTLNFTQETKEKRDKNYFSLKINSAPKLTRRLFETLQTFSCQFKWLILFDGRLNYTGYVPPVVLKESFTRFISDVLRSINSA